MKFSVAAAALIAPLASATLTFNITAALAPGEFTKYSCLTTEKWIANPKIPNCLKECTKYANARDGCAYDDMACHCVNYVPYSKLIEPCVFPPQLGYNGTCTLAELGAARPIVNDMCNFFNATFYAAYTNCPKITLSPKKTTLLRAIEDVKITH